MGKKEKVFLFDLDDTLMWNEYTYSLAVMEFFELLMKVFKKRLPLVCGIGRRVEEITLEMIKKTNPKTDKLYGFSMSRWPDSFVMCYKELCEKGWGEYDPKVAEEVHKIGLKTFDENLYRQTGLVPGAELVLDFLKAKGDILILLTKGDGQVQKRKIFALDLPSWFDSFVVVDHKSENLFGGFKRGFEDVGRTAIFSVGNSYSSDIEPALKAGIGAIFIPCFTWKAESTEKGRLTLQQQCRLYEIKEIRQIIDIYDKI